MNYDQFRQECLDFRSREGNGQAKLESILHRIAGTRDMESVDEEHFDAIVNALKAADRDTKPKAGAKLDATAIFAKWNGAKRQGGRVNADDGDGS